jgi:hypothetical protein
MAITASIVGPTFITVMMDGKTHTINGDHMHYDAIREALKNKDHARVESLINVRQAVIKYAAGKVTVDGDRVMYGDHEIKGSVVQRILAMIREGFDPQPMVRFLQNLMANPSKRAVDELYGFLESTALPITEDGCFLAYKKVNDNYRDFYTGTMDNSVGTVVEMPRNQVDDERGRTCSYGLHFCSLSYLPHYHGGHGRVMIVKINPADVVSIPSDYNNAKGRACRYEVIGEHAYEDREAFNTPVWRAPVESVEEELADDDSEWRSGYDAGEAAATRDSEAVRGYNDVPPAGHSISFQDGYREGYGDNYTVDWCDAGYNKAEADVEAGNAYNDTPPDGCDSEGDYREGYADGWRDAKVARI